MKLYEVDDRALKYYRKLLKHNSKRDVNIDNDVLIKRITAMCYTGIKIDCVNKQGIKKIYCNGYKLTVDWDNYFVKYIAILRLSKNDFSEHNKKLLDASTSPIMLNKLSKNYQRLGLNSLGLVQLQDTERDYTYLDTKTIADKYEHHVFNDIRHKCESELITDPMTALYICRTLYDVTNERRDAKNSKMNSMPNKRVYVTRVLNKQLGNTLAW